MKKLVIIHFLTRGFFVPPDLMLNEFDRLVVTPAKNHYIISVSQMLNDTAIVIHAERSKILIGVEIVQHCR